VSVAVSDGDSVAAGQLLLSVEAMKMEHQLLAEVAGTVHISVRAGQPVKADQVLATIHAEANAEANTQANAEAHTQGPPRPGGTIHDPLNTGEGA
jgi:acetyl-CoA/propionyl-CoA carboxylase biotin carboxyl carrier protein